MVGELELYPIYGLWHTPFWQTREFYYGLIVLGILAGSVFFWFFIRRYYKRKRIKTPWQQALDYLDELRGLVESGDRHDGKQFYLCVTGLFKQYLYARYGFEVMGKTDEEVLIFLENRAFDKDFVNNLGEILRHGLQVKFANSQTIKSLLERDHLQCIALIKKTIPEK